MTDARTPADPAPPEEPTTIWQAIKWDVPVFLLAAIALAINVFRPDELASVKITIFGLAVLWIGYRIVRKIQAVQTRT